MHQTWVARKLATCNWFFQRACGEPSRRISQLWVFDFTIEAAFPSIRTQRPSPFSSRSTLSSESILGVLQGLILIQVRFTQTTINRRSVVRNYVHQFWHSHSAGIPAGMKQLATILHPKLFCYVPLVNHLVFPSIPPPKFSKQQEPTFSHLAFQDFSHLHHSHGAGSGRWQAAHHDVADHHVVAPCGCHGHRGGRLDPLAELILGWNVDGTSWVFLFKPWWESPSNRFIPSAPKKWDPGYLTNLESQLLAALALPQFPCPASTSTLCRALGLAAVAAVALGAAFALVAWTAVAWTRSTRSSKTPKPREVPSTNM